MSTKHAALFGALVGLFVAAAGRAADPPAKPEPVAIYDPKPDHAWNRLHRAVFVRTRPDGKEAGRDALDPLLWPQTDHLLTGQSHKDALAGLDALLGPDGADAVRDPLKRAVLQRDLWAVFEWAADPYLSRYGRIRYGPGPDRVYPVGGHPVERKALQMRLAQAIGRLALPATALRELPDNYAAAVKAKAYPTRFDPDHPDRPFLPDDLFTPEGPWVCVGGAPEGAPLAMAHAKFFSGRSALLVFIRLPDGRQAMLDYLDKLGKAGPPLVARETKLADGTLHRDTDFRPGLPQFPVGTQVALVRQMMLIADDGQLRESPITESVQVRVIRRIPREIYLNHQAALANQAAFEFELRRADLFAGKAGGLRPVPPDEPVYLSLQFVAGFDDPFEKPRDDRPHRMSVRDSCAACHSNSGIYGVNSYTRRHSIDHGVLPQDPSFRPSSPEGEWDKAVTWKRERYLWGLLRGLNVRE